MSLVFSFDTKLCVFNDHPKLFRHNLIRYSLDMKGDCDVQKGEMISINYINIDDLNVEATRTMLILILVPFLCLDGLNGVLANKNVRKLCCLISVIVTWV